jgi:hypothetical protein
LRDGRTRLVVLLAVLEDETEVVAHL